MKSEVRFGPLVAPVLVVSAAAFLIAGDIYSIQPSGLTVHEWGTFTSVAGEDGRSAAVRKRMQLAQKLRWRKLKQDSEPPEAESAKPKKRKMSAAGRAAIAAAVKKRWAAVKAKKAAA